MGVVSRGTVGDGESAEIVRISSEWRIFGFSRGSGRGGDARECEFRGVCEWFEFPRVARGVDGGRRVVGGLFGRFTAVGGIGGK